MKKFCPALLVWFLSLAGVNESVRPQVESPTVSRVEAIPSEEGEPTQQATRAESRLYFPDYVDGGGWSVQLALSNVARRVSAAVAVTAYDQDGQPLPDLFDSETTFEIPPLGSQVLRSVGTGEIRRGWIEVRSVPPAVSGLLTYRHSESGVEVGVAPVPLGDRFALFVEESSEIGTGLALFKPEAHSEVEFRLRDEAGTDPFGQDLTVGDFQQRARTLPEWFNPIGATFPGDFRGLLFLRTGEDASFAPLGLRFGKRKDSLSAVPGIRFLGEAGGGAPNPFQPTTSTAGPLYFPDYVDGGGWSVQLVLGNLDPDRSVPVEVEVYDQKGRSVGGLFDSESRFELPAQGSRVLRSAGGTRIRRGWIKVQADSTSVRGLLVYRHTETGIEVGVAPVEPRDQFALFVEESSEIGTGLALFKPQVNSKVEFRIRDEAGNDPLGDVYVPWRNFRQSARTLSEWFDVDGVETGFLKDFRGLLFLRTEDGSEFAPVGLRFGKETSALSAVPGIGIVDGVRIAAGVGSDGGVEIDGGVGIDGGGMAPPPTVTLSVAPSSIDRGQSTTLRWSSTNAESVEITPDIGRVSTSGTRKVSPGTTTTYRITVTAADGQTATASVTVTVAITDRAVLEALYEATDGPNWVNNDNWLTDAPLGEWHGIDTDTSGRVVQIDLGGRWDGDNRQYLSHGLTGTIPPELGHLANLKQLDLQANDLTGTIPPELGDLANLEVLDLWRNSLSGVIPPQLGDLANLRTLQLGRNLLQDRIPPQLGGLINLELLDLRHNQLTGPIPPELRSLASLEVLRFGWNRLSGVIPSWIGDYSDLRELGLRENDFTGPIPPELGNLTNLRFLLLDANNLTGPIPPELGNLDELDWLWVQANDLRGPIPPSLLRLEQLTLFQFDRNESLCVPGTTGFVTWLKGIENHGPNCNESDVTVLDYLYRSTGGEDWTNSDGWLGDSAVSEWNGVRADSLGRVTGLDLSDNGLEGRLPNSLGRLEQLTELRIDGNDLSGRLPGSLTRLSLEEFHYADTDLCVPNEPSFRAWLNAIESHDGTGVRCRPPSNRDILVALYDMTGGPDWSRSENWLTEAPIAEWHGVTVGNRGRVTELSLYSNQLTGSIPPELGKLSNLEWLDLCENQLEGEIPPELGNLSNLETLCLGSNQLTGSIPPELGRLSNLWELSLDGNQLEGEIPPELGKLSNLGLLALSENRLEGEIPPELGRLSSLEWLYLANNHLEGSLSPELGRLRRLKAIALAHNSGLSGTLSSRWTSLRQLEELLTNGTDLCAPSDARFQDWLEGIWKRRVAPCSRALPRAYLTQAVQSRDFPVPLVAGEKALLRVFLTASDGYGGRFPPIRARFYVRNRERHVLDIPGKSTPAPTEVDEGSLRTSAHAEVPAKIVQPGLEMVIEIDPEGTLGSGTGRTKRIPDTGRMAVEVQAMPAFDLTLIPFLLASAPDREILDLVEDMAAEPESHLLLWDTRTLLPIKELHVTAHESVLTSSSDPIDLLSETAAIRVMEGGSGFYKGMMSGPTTGGFAGYAYQPGNSSFSVPDAHVMAHELGHNLNLGHAPCRATKLLDPSFPETDGSIGGWGYDFRKDGLLVYPEQPDLMSYCGPPDWISDYHFTNALRYRLHVAAKGKASSLVAAAAQSLLLWGGIDAGGTPFLEPAFVVNAPASLPRSSGEYELIGRDADGGELFSLAFQMPELADGDGRSSFTFVLPVQPEWAGTLASITLSSPGGSVTVDENTHRPVTILRNPQSGQVRAILRGAGAAPQNVAATVSTLSVDTVLERFTSHGLPDPEDWSR